MVHQVFLETSNELQLSFIQSISSLLRFPFSQQQVNTFLFHFTCSGVGWLLAPHLHQPSDLQGWLPCPAFPYPSSLGCMWLALSVRMLSLKSLLKASLEEKSFASGSIAVTLRTLHKVQLLLLKWTFFVSVRVRYT